MFSFRLNIRLGNSNRVSKYKSSMYSNAATFSSSYSRVPFTHLHDKVGNGNEGCKFVWHGGIAVFGKKSAMEPQIKWRSCHTTFAHGLF